MIKTSIIVGFEAAATLRGGQFRSRWRGHVASPTPSSVRCPNAIAIKASDHSVLGSLKLSADSAIVEEVDDLW